MIIDNADREVTAFQLNPEGDLLDYAHILREAGTSPDEAYVYKIWEPLPNALPDTDKMVLSGSALTINEEMEPILRARSEIIAYTALDFAANKGSVLGICYGAQIVANELWPGSVSRSNTWNVGRTLLIPERDHAFLGKKGVPLKISVSYKDKIIGIPDEYVLARDTDGNILAYQFGNFIGILGHPEIPPHIIKWLIGKRQGDPRYPNINVLELTEDQESSITPSIKVVERFLSNQTNEQ